MQKYLYNSASELSKLGVDVWTLGSSTLRADPSRSPERNLVVETPFTPRPSLRSLLLFRRSLDFIIDLIERVDPDVIHLVNKHVWNYLLLLVFRGTRRHVKAKWVHTFHDPTGHDGDTVQHWVIAYHRLVQRLLDAVVVHSKVAQIQTLTILRTKCHVEYVPLGLKPWPEYTRMDPRFSKRVLVFGRINSYKGCKMYPEIFNELYRLDSEIKIVVAGQVSDDLPAGLLKRIASCPNVELKTHFIEEPDVGQYFREAALVLTPYASTTQSGVVLDAFSFSRAVLAFRIEGMNEMLPTGAPTARPFDIREYARIVVNLVNDHDACTKEGRDAWEFGRQRFSLNAMAIGFLRTYHATRGPVAGCPDTGDFQK